MVLRVEDLVVEFPAGRGRTVHAVSGVSLDIAPGETLGLVGESGCGKTTTGRAIMQLESARHGRVELGGVDLGELSGTELRRARRRMQIIFQDPVSALNPRRTVRDLVAEGLTIWDDHGLDRAAIGRRVDEILNAVGLDASDDGNRRPTEFSGGQCQRINIARALLLQPDLLICDEPVSALDVSVQAQILNLLEDLTSQLGLALLFISHDLAVVRNVSDRIAVMYLGKVCEIADSTELFDRPTHPYTRALLASIPGRHFDLPPAAELISGELPSPIDPPSGCRFRTRCPRETALCSEAEPTPVEISPGHHVACHHPHLEAGTLAPDG